MQRVAIEKSEPEATLANALYLVTSHSQGGLICDVGSCYCTNPAFYVRFNSKGLSMLGNVLVLVEKTSQTKITQKYLKREDDIVGRARQQPNTIFSTVNPSYEFIPMAPTEMYSTRMKSMNFSLNGFQCTLANPMEPHLRKNHCGLCSDPTDPMKRVERSWKERSISMGYKARQTQQRQSSARQYTQKHQTR
jgi:hypothetical protein